MRRLFLISMLAVLVVPAVAGADQTDPVDGGATTGVGAVRVTIVKVGGSYSVAAVAGGGSEEQTGCSWTVVFSPGLEDAPWGTSAGPMPTPDSRFALLLCNGSIVRAIWVEPADIIDLDALAEDEAQRYIEDVLVPTVRIGVNPAARGLVGLRSWFWIEGFTGSATAPPITAFGMTIDVRMSSGTITWDFGDGTVDNGDLGRAYPAESSVQHAHQDDGTYTITATIDLVPEYRVDGGPWLTLPGLQAVATAQHDVEERQAVITGT
jgi:hypothetical protein